MAFHTLVMDQALRALSRESLFRDRTNLLDSYSDSEMYGIYRFTRRGVMHLIDVFGQDLEHATTRSKAIAAPIQIFNILYYFGQKCLERSDKKGQLCQTVGELFDDTVRPQCHPSKHQQEVSNGFKSTNALKNEAVCPKGSTARCLDTTKVRTPIVLELKFVFLSRKF